MSNKSVCLFSEGECLLIKQFFSQGPEDVMKMGIENYNAECRKIVMRYSEEWEVSVFIG